MAELSQKFCKARSINQTSNGFVSKVPINRLRTKDEGTAIGSSVFNLVRFINGLYIIPYGVGADNTTMSVRVIGWRQLGGDETGLWIPVVLAEVLCTLAMEAVGVDGMDVLSTEKFADTLVLVRGNNDVTVELVSAGNGLIAHFVADLKGFQKVELSFSTGGSVTSCNALIALVG